MLKKQFVKTNFFIRNNFIIFALHHFYSLLNDKKNYKFSYKIIL